jgi:hypothetical protein
MNVCVPSVYLLAWENSVKLPIAAFANPNDVSRGFAVSLPKLTLPNAVPKTPTDSRLMLRLM